MDVFESCAHVASLLAEHDDSSAREALIRVLDYVERTGGARSPLVNHLVRETGLYPYLDIDNANWDDRYVFEAFKVDIGGGSRVTLHREQSTLLKRLLNDESLAVSAPTSFGKSFVIDAFIAIKKPKNVAIIVPTLALTDETRRRIQKKFGRTYRIITTSDVALADRNIFVFPQERAIQYLGKIKRLDLLVIDEFYKASPNFDKERAASLQRVILKFGEVAAQRYFLAPNIADLKESLFTDGMEFVPIDFNTVYLEKHELYKTLAKDHSRKTDFLVDLLAKGSRTLVYAGTYTEIKKVGDELIQRTPRMDKGLALEFSDWLAKHYEPRWNLTKLASRSIGIHNGQLHRSLSQIQVKLFEEPMGLTTLLSTSSIIEGVNTSAENVVLWSNKSGGPGNAKLKDFSYRNIIGRGGRMLRHFIGKIYILEPPPAPADTQLELPMPEAVLGNIDEVKYKPQLTTEQVARIASYKEEMRELLGVYNIDAFLNSSELCTSDAELLRKIALKIRANPNEWRGIGFLNSNDPQQWMRTLRNAFFLKPNLFPRDLDVEDVLTFVRVLTNNWTQSIPALLGALRHIPIGIDDFFKLERAVSYGFSALVSDVCLINNRMTGARDDVSSFVGRLSSAFLPPNVFRLEEYGLPRMLSRKISKAGLLNLTSHEIPLHDCLYSFRHIGIERVLALPEMDKFDKFILQEFYDGLE